MTISKGLFIFKCGVLVTGLLFVAGLNEVSGQTSDPIGQVTAVQRVVLVTHPDETKSRQVNLAGSVLFKDIYETKKQARLKVLFDDDSILSLGELTQVQITENIYSPGENKRSTVIDLLKGTLRTLVGKVFGGPGSKFEVHTPTAVAAARGTYFIVWMIDSGKTPVTGIVNIGESGLVEVGSRDAGIPDSVTLKGNQFTQVAPGKPPTHPAAIDPARLLELIRSTEIKDQVKEDIPRGMDAPGSDVSRETASMLPEEKEEGEGLAPVIGFFLFPDEEEGRFKRFPAVPPIQQQPRTEPSPASVNVSF